MHYKNGREAREGDAVITKSGNVVVGKLHSLYPGATRCNAQIAYAIMGGLGNACVTVGDCYHAEDAWTLIDSPTITAKASDAAKA